MTAARRGKGKNMAKDPNAALLQKLGLEGPRALAYGAPLSPPPHTAYWTNPFLAPQNNIRQATNHQGRKSEH